MTARKGPNERAVGRTLRDLKAEGVLALVPEAVVEMCRSLARAVDAEPGNAALFREYRSALDDLREMAASGPDDDAAQFLISIQSPHGRAKVVDAEDA